MVGALASRFGISILTIIADTSLSAWVGTGHCTTDIPAITGTAATRTGGMATTPSPVRWQVTHITTTPTIITTTVILLRLRSISFADVRERLAQEAAGEPDQVSLSDRYFEDAVKAFGAGDYDLAAETFAKAIEFAPDDMILPFAYCQALFAGEKYTEAAEVLRTALAKVSPEKEGVFYPRGLYAKDDVLFAQIGELAEKAELYSFDGDLQLLLGYQLLGIGEIDEAVEPLRLAGQNLRNASSATVLLELLEKIRIQKADEAD